MTTTAPGIGTNCVCPSVWVYLEGSVHFVFFKALRKKWNKMLLYYLISIIEFTQEDFLYTITLVYKIFQHEFNITHYEEIPKSGGTYIYGDNTICSQTEGLVVLFLFWAL